MSNISKGRMDMECQLPELFNKAILIIKEYTGMKFYEEMKPLYMETDAFRVRLGAAVLHTREGTSCPHR